MNPTITLSQAVQGFMYTAQARHLSENTILDYQNTIGKFRLYLEQDLPIGEIDRRHIEGFLVAQTGRTNKTLLNYYVGLSALWSWALREKFVQENVVRAVPAPKPEIRDIVPYTRDEIKALLGSLSRSRVYQRAGQNPTDHAVPFPERNRALILLLLDTGIRVEELCQAKIHHLDKRNSRLYIYGKGARERHVKVSAITSQAIWRYLATRGADVDNGDYLFVTDRGRGFRRHRVLHLLQTIGRRAGVPNVTVHRFRHTCSIEYLRNGGDPYTLQKLLGHTTLEMVKKYLAIAQIDLDNVHRRASPVDNWRL